MAGTWVLKTQVPLRGFKPENHEEQIRKTKSRTTNQKTQIEKPQRSSMNPDRTQERRWSSRWSNPWFGLNLGEQPHESDWTQATTFALGTWTMGFMHFSEPLMWSLKKEKWRKKKNSQNAEKWRKKKNSQNAEIVSLRLKFSKKSSLLGSSFKSKIEFLGLEMLVS